MENENVTPLVAEMPRGVQKKGAGWEIELDYPIEHDGQKLSTATMRRPTVGDIEIMSRHAEDEKDAAYALVIMGSRLLGLSEDEVRTIDAEDWSRIQGVILPHMEKLNPGKPT